MNFGITDQPRYQEFRKFVREFVAKEIEPYAEHTDRTGEYPERQLKAMVREHFTGYTIPKEYGGEGKNLMELAIVMEEFARSCPSSAIVMTIYLMGVYPLLLAGTEEQKKKYLPLFAKAERTPGFALSEAHCGSDAAALSTTAVLDGDEWVLNGHKFFVGNGSKSDTYFVFAKTDPEKGNKGITCFLVESSTPGFKEGKIYDKMGLNGQRTAEFYLENCRIPKENMIGELNKGFKVAMGALDKARVLVAAESVGISEAALAEAANFASSREAFGQKIGDFQGISFKLADMAAKLQAAKLCCYRAASMEEHIDEIGGRNQFSTECSIAKLYCAEVCNQIVYDATQIFGGRGILKGMKVERLYRDARVMTLFEGSSEIQRMVIGRNVLTGKWVCEI